MIKYLLQQKKTLPKQRWRPPELQNSLWKVAFFPPKNFRTGETNKVVNIITKPPGDGSHIPPNGKFGKSSTQICPFFGGICDMLVSWRVSPPQKNVSTPWYLRIAKPNVSHLLGANHSFFFVFTKMVGKLLNYNDETKKNAMTSKVDSDQTEDTVSASNPLEFQSNQSNRLGRTSFDSVPKSCGLEQSPQSSARSWEWTPRWKKLEFAQGDFEKGPS